MKRTVFWSLFLAGGLSATAHAGNEKTGVIEVRSDPAGASVYVEGFFSGTTPTSVPDVPAGEYRVVVKQADHADYVEDIVVAENQTTAVSATLPNEGWRAPVRAEDDFVPVVGKEARKPYEKAKSTTRLREYRVLEIANFLMKSEEPLSPEFRFAIFHDLARQLDEQTTFESFATTYTKGPSERWTENPVHSEAPTLVLSGAITEYTAGSQTKRYLVGFGAGKTRAYCLFRLVDKATGEVLFERMENGSVSMGLLGGSSAGAMKEIGEDIAKAIRKNW